jgi:dTDP-4-amino-4,6-dideoxygalactose transaminase
MIHLDKHNNPFFGRYLVLPPPDWNLIDLLYSFLHLATKNNSTEDLESAIKRFFGTSHVMVTNLGRTALTLGLKAIGLEKGAGVILPTVICSTVIKAVLQAECRPILVDVEKNLHVSVGILDSCQEKARAVIVPHLYGLSAPIQEIREWSKKEGLYLIDDAAQAVGISLGGKYLGTFGDFGILSFGPFKSLSTPRGGALISENGDIIASAKKNVLQPESLYSAIRRVLGGFVKFRLRSYYLRINDLSHKKMKGPNSSGELSNTETTNEMFQVSHLEAQLVQSVLGRSTSIVTNRRETAHETWKMLKMFDNFEFVGQENAPYIKIPIRLQGGLTAEEAVRRLRTMRIEAERIYPPLHLYKEYKDYVSKALPKAEENWGKIFLIPNPVTKRESGINRLAQAFEILNKV